MLERSDAPVQPGHALGALHLKLRALALHPPIDERICSLLVRCHGRGDLQGECLVGPVDSLLEAREGLEEGGGAQEVRGLEGANGSGGTSEGGFPLSSSKAKILRLGVRPT